MATDNDLLWAESDSLEVWAPIHAWRALGQLHAEAAIEPLMPLFHKLDDMDWVTDEMPKVYGRVRRTERSGSKTTRCGLQQSVSCQIR